MASVDLVFPPFTGVPYPYLSTAALSAYVQQESDHHVRQLDLNARAVSRMLSSAHVETAVKRASERLEELEGRLLDGHELFEYARCAEVLHDSPYIVQELPWALDAVRDPVLALNPVAARRADLIISRALDASTCTMPPQWLSFQESVYEIESGDSEALRASLRETPSLPWGSFNEVVDPNELWADVVGISIVYRSQVMPGLALAAWIKRNRPVVKVLVGGPIFTALRGRLARHPWLFDVVDGFVLHEGEIPLVDYLNAVDGKQPQDEITGLAWRDESGRVVSNPPPASLNPETLPTPDFDDFDLSAYHSPGVVLPLLASRGCYWRCAFCTHHHVYRNPYQVRSESLLARDLLHLADRYGCRHVYFVDESISPHMLRRITNAINATSLDIHWGCELRFERNLQQADLTAAFESGCRVFSFGLESASQRILDAMDKGIDVPSIDRIVRETWAAGIHVHIMCIVGFPGETLGDLDLTLDFVRRWNSHIDLIGFSYFCLNDGSPVAADPAKYGIVGKQPLVNGFDFEERDRYDVLDGLSQAEAFEQWLSVIARDETRAIFGRVGHSQRERFLFSPGTGRYAQLEERAHDQMVNDLGETDVAIWSHTHDLSSARAFAQDVWEGAARAYNVDGISLREFWETVADAGCSEPSREPLFYLTRDLSHEEVVLDATTVQRLVGASTVVR